MDKRGQFGILLASPILMPLIQIGISLVLGIILLGTFNDGIKTMFGIDIITNGIYRNMAIVFGAYIAFLVIQNISKSINAETQIRPIPLVGLIGLGVVFLNFGLTGKLYSTVSESAVGAESFSFETVLLATVGALIAGAILVFAVEPLMLRHRIRR